MFSTDRGLRPSVSQPLGGSISVLPVPIGDSPVRGFAFTSDLDEIERLTLLDVSGAELDTIEP